MTFANPAPANPAPKQVSLTAAYFFIGIPIVLVAICLAAKFGLMPLGASTRVALIFTLLVALMLTGMPISIALGLTVLIFLFTLTEVPLDAVALKLFTGIERFEIMSIPFFILAGGFLTHGGVARRMIDFATSLIGHWHGGLALAAIVACAMFALVCGSSVDPEGDLCHLHQHLDRRAVRRRSFAWNVADRHALHGYLVHGQAQQFPAHGKSDLAAGLARVPPKRLGVDAGRRHHRRHLQRRFHRHRSRRDGRGLRVLRGG